MSKLVFASCNFFAIAFCAFAAFVSAEEILNYRSVDALIYGIVLLALSLVFLTTYLTGKGCRYIVRMALSLSLVLLLVYDLWQTWWLSGLGGWEFMSEGFALASLAHAALILVFLLIASKSYRHFQGGA